MSRARLVITAITVQGLSQAEAARSYGLSPAWVSRLMARWRVEGEAAFQPHSRRPRTSPTAIPAATIEAIANLRADLRRRGLDHGPATIAWHLDHHAGVTVSRATIARVLTRAGLVTPAPGKRPKASYIRFEAAMPNECWQSDFTHWALADGADTEILTFLDDCTRFALSITAHRVVTTPIVLSAFRGAVAAHGIPASTLTDNGMVFTVRLAGWGSRGGRNAFEHELRRLGVQQKNGSPWHPQTQGKVERFQQTMKRWLAAQRPASTLDELQTQLDAFATAYNEHRPHRSLPHHATPATRYRALPKAGPSTGRDDDTHDRVRHDKTDQKGTVTLRHASRLHHIPLGAAHARRVLMLVTDLDIRIIDAATGELLRELVLDPDRDYQPLGNAKGRT